MLFCPSFGATGAIEDQQEDGSDRSTTVAFIQRSARCIYAAAAPLSVTVSLVMTDSYNFLAFCISLESFLSEM